MQAVEFSRYGSPETLTLVEDAAIPSPSARQVLIRVHASGVNPIDWQLASGQYRWLVRTRLPAVPGMDVAGTVVRVGDSVSTVSVGDTVFGLTANFGACAEFALVKQASLAPVPATMDLVQAAALPLAGLTALQCLRDHGGMLMGESNQRVLVVGASGGVGHYAVQIAHASGARVSGVCSGANMQLVSELGADHVFDYRTQDDFGDDYDIIVDTVGQRGFSSWRKSLSRRGRYVTTNPSGKDILWTIATRISRSRRCNAMIFRPRGGDLKLLARMADNSQLRSVVEQTFALADLPDAHRTSMTGHVRGKLVVTCNGAREHRFGRQIPCTRISFEHHGAPSPCGARGQRCAGRCAYFPLQAATAKQPPLQPTHAKPQTPLEAPTRRRCQSSPSTS